MSKIAVTKGHSLSLEEVRHRLKDFEASLSKWGVKLLWKGDKAKIKGVGVSGDVSVSAKDVAITLKLGMLAKAAGVDATRLQGSIERRLEEGLRSA